MASPTDHHKDNRQPMKYVGTPQYRHDTPPCTGVLLTNLGTPDEPTVPALRRYLAEFLSDRRVIETSGLIWQPILHGIILRTRPRRSAAAYAKIWTEAGSPLLAITRRQAQAVGEELASRCPGPVQVEPAMRYGNPSIASALARLREANARRLLVVPLYPQYSAATTASTFDAVAAELSRWRWLPELRMVNHYHDHPGYIEALVESVRQFWAEHERPDRLLLSFHGLPKKYFLAGDPYYCECQKTARLLADELGLAENQWAVSFQSRFGPTEWLQPYTDKLLQQWAGAGVGNVHVICPGFSADCLETLEEISMQNRGLFLEAGGKSFSYIPALNDEPDHIHVLAQIVTEHCQGWPEFAADYDAATMRKELQRSRQRAEKLAGTL
jgi:ferrochelatase